MGDQRSVRLAAAVHDQALGIGARRGIRKTERVLHVETCAVRPDDARIGPEEAFLAVGKLLRDAVDAHRLRQQPGDEVDQVHVVTADIGERVGVLRGHPVLEIRMAVVPLLQQAGGAQAEIAEQSLAIAAARRFPEVP